MSSIAAGTTTTTALVSTGDTTGKLVLKTNGTTDAVTIDTSQNVGIGTGSPSSKFHVAGGSDPTITLQNTTGGESTLTLVAGGNSSIRTTAGLTFYINTSSEAMRIDSSGNVLVGASSVTGSAAPKLYVSGGATDGTQGIQIINYKPALVFSDISAGNHNYQIASDDGALLFGYEGGTAGSSNTFTERMRITSAGEVLIGTTTATNNLRYGEKLGIVATGTSYGGISLSSYCGTTDSRASLIEFARSTGTTDGSFTAVADGDRLASFIFKGADGTQWVDSSYILAEAEGTVSAGVVPGRLMFYTSSTGTPSERMRITSTGDVGIGTSSPANIGANYPHLEVNGVVTGVISASVGGVRGISLTADGSAANIQARVSGQPLTFQTNSGSGSTERMRIDSSGNLLVGGTSPNESFAFPTIQGATNCLFTNRRNVTTGASQFRFYNPNGLVGEISTSGSTTTYATSSDYRLKENVQPMQNALGVVAQLKPVTYTWKADGSQGQGFIAHELQAVVPDCVTGEKDAVDADGKPVYQGVDTSFLVATLTAAIQELKAELDAAKERIATLEAK